MHYIINIHMQWYIICAAVNIKKKHNFCLERECTHIVVRSLPGQQPYGCSWARLIPVCFYLFHRKHRPIHAQCVGWMKYQKHRMHREMYPEIQQQQKQHSCTFLKTIDGCDMVFIYIYICYWWVSWTLL